MRNGKLDILVESPNITPSTYVSSFLLQTCAETMAAARWKPQSVDIGFWLLLLLSLIPEVRYTKIYMSRCNAQVQYSGVCW